MFTINFVIIFSVIIISYCQNEGQICNLQTEHKLSDILLSKCLTCFDNHSQFFVIRGKVSECVSCAKFPHKGDGKFFALHFVGTKEYCHCPFIKAPYTTDQIWLFTRYDLTFVEDLGNKY